MREHRGLYDGPVEILVDETERLDAWVHLVKYVEVIETRTEPATRRDGTQSWHGFLPELSARERKRLVDHQLDLELPSGQTGRAVMTESKSVS
jgi:hypothetical protein